MVSTPLKNISQIGNLPQIGVKIKNIWNHHLVKSSIYFLAVAVILKTWTCKEGHWGLPMRVFSTAAQPCCGWLQPMRCWKKHVGSCQKHCNSQRIPWRFLFRAWILELWCGSPGLNGILDSYNQTSNKTFGWRQCNQIPADDRAQPVERLELLGALGNSKWSPTKTSWMLTGSTTNQLG